MNGKAASVVHRAAVNQRLLDFAAAADAAEGIRQGLVDANTVRTQPAAPRSTFYAPGMACRVELTEPATRTKLGSSGEAHKAGKRIAQRQLNRSYSFFSYDFLSVCFSNQMQQYCQTPVSKVDRLARNSFNCIVGSNGTQSSASL